MPVKSFDAIYLVDLCEPLLEIARRRFAARGWTNVHVVHQDACDFSLPAQTVSLVTLSYSLSMIPSYHNLLDRIDRMLDPRDGLVGVADFYTARKSANLHEQSIGGDGKLCTWLGHWFWQVYLSRTCRTVLIRMVCVGRCGLTWIMLTSLPDDVIICSTSLEPSRSSITEIAFSFLGLCKCMFRDIPFLVPCSL